jgi:hypothetical protein
LRLAAPLVAGIVAIAPVYAQYAGPAILARGEAPAAMSAASINFRPFVTLSATYDTGLGSIAVTDQGQLATGASYGVSIAGGISGSKQWKRTSVGLDYRGSYTHYKQTQPQSYDQSLLLGVKYKVSPHIRFNLRESAGLFTRDFGLAELAQTVPFDPVGSYVPTTDFFDNRTIYLTTQADLIFQKTARLSFDLGGGVFINRRLSTALYSAVGQSAQGDVQYRIARRQTIGALYGFNHMGFTHLIGGTDVHYVAGSYSIRPTRRLEFSVIVGMMRQENKFLQAVAVDPVIAALLGVTQSVQLYHGIQYRPRFSARVSKIFHNGVVYASAGNDVTPGNGLFLTSYATTAMGGYSYTGLRHWSVSASGGGVWAQARGPLTGGYGNATAQLSIARTIGRGMSSTFTYSARQYTSPDFQKYNRLIYTLAIGVAFSPGNIPLRVW